jgi:hypothetical protein
MDRQPDWLRESDQAGFTLSCLGMSSGLGAIPFCIAGSRRKPDAAAGHWSAVRVDGDAEEQIATLVDSRAAAIVPGASLKLVL